MLRKAVIIVASLASFAWADSVQPIVPTGQVTYGSAQKTLTSNSDVKVDTTTHKLTASKGVITSTITFADGSILASTASISQVSTTWGNITGTLSNQSDLKTALNAIGTSTATLAASTGTLQASLASSTATINARLNQVATDTTTLSRYFPVSLSTSVTGTLSGTNLGDVSSTYLLTSSATATYCHANGTNCGGISAGYLVQPATLTFILPVGVVASTVTASKSLLVGNNATNVWNPLQSMHVGRLGAGVVQLDNGKVLSFAGRLSGGRATDYAEIYDPDTGNWTATGRLNTPRMYFDSVKMANGKVLAISGANVDFSALTTSCEIYDPATGVWTTTGSLTTARYHQASGLLPNGYVITAGGLNLAGTRLSSVEVLNPVTMVWGSTTSLTQTRGSPYSAVLGDGRFMVMGGTAPLNSEVFNSNTGLWTTYNLPTLRSGASFWDYWETNSAIRLDNGNMLAMSGENNTAVSITSDTVIFDQNSNTWSQKSNYPKILQAVDLWRLPGNRILAAGGWDGFTTASSATYIYDVANDTWTQAPFMAVGKYLSSLQNPNVYVNGNPFFFGGDHDASHFDSDAYYFMGSSMTLDVSAAFQVTSSTKAFLPPKMSSSQRDSIGSPTPGLMLYNTSTDYVDYYSSRSVWKDLLSTDFYPISLTTGVAGFLDISANTNLTASGSANLSGDTLNVGPISLSTGVVGNLGVSHLNSGSSAGSTTFWRGDGTWAVPALQNSGNPIAVSTGSSSGFTGVISSPTAVLNFEATQFIPALKGGATGYIALNQSSVTLMGNTFNGSSKLVQLNSGSQYPALDGNLITNLNAGNVTGASALSDSVLSSNVPLKNSSDTFTGAETYYSSMTVLNSILANTFTSPNFSTTQFLKTDSNKSIVSFDLLNVGQIWNAPEQFTSSMTVIVSGTPTYEVTFGTTTTSGVYDLAVSTTGITIPRLLRAPPKTKTQLMSDTPSDTGLAWYCSNCTTDGIVVSTATTPGGVARITSRSTQIQ